MIASDGLMVGTSTEDGVHVVTLAGEIDFGNVTKLRAALIEVAKQDTDAEIRMGGVTFLDSTALGVLVQAKKRIEESGHRMGMVDVTPRVKRTLEVAGLAGYLGV